MYTCEHPYREHDQHAEQELNMGAKPPHGHCHYCDTVARVEYANICAACGEQVASVIHEDHASKDEDTASDTSYEPMPQLQRCEGEGAQHLWHWQDGWPGSAEYDELKRLQSIVDNLPVYRFSDTIHNQSVPVNWYCKTMIQVFDMLHNSTEYREMEQLKWVRQALVDLGLYKWLRATNRLTYSIDMVPALAQSDAAPTEAVHVGDENVDGDRTVSYVDDVLTQRSWV